MDCEHVQPIVTCGKAELTGICDISRPATASRPQIAIAEKQKNVGKRPVWNATPTPLTFSSDTQTSTVFWPHCFSRAVRKKSFASLADNNI
jgi:hypothetical protein